MYNYRYSILDENDNAITEGITREILVESSKPTFVNIAKFIPILIILPYDLLGILYFFVPAVNNS